MTPIRVLRGEVQTPATPPSKGMSLTWKRWITSALNAFLSASAASVTTGSAATYFGVNATTSLKIAGATAVGAGFFSFCKWMAQHPLPGADQ